MYNHGAESALPPYRILDLTEGGCMLGGRLLADLGADVIKIEPPRGSPSRTGPYYRNIVDPEKSLFWWAYNANKRGITLDISREEGRELFRSLVRGADAVLESFEPGYLDRLKLGYNDLVRIRPDIILTSITPFGQNGPKAHYRASDLTIWASGAYLFACGNPDRPPTRIGFPQAGLFGGAEGAIGTMTAIWHRNNTGEGQHVDVSMQESALSPNLNVLQMWDVNGVEFHRLGGALYVPGTGVRQPIYFECRDGYVMILVQGGNEPFVSSSARLVKWMEEEGMAPEWLVKLDWKLDYDATTMGQSIADRVGEAVKRFTLTKTKAELYEDGAIRRQILMAPVANTRDISENLQLKSRNYWEKLEHADLGDSVVYCGPFIRMSETPLKYRRRAPLIGEHNDEIFGEELGVPGEKINSLKEKGII
jgi:crotonobetainyl-CoA:carnitine CoA-transferase CaiB-like acyl-CoA transferase